MGSLVAACVWLIAANLRDGAFPIAQADFAALLGVSRVSAGKALQALKHRGLITLGYRIIHVPDADALRAWLAGNNTLAPRAR